MSNVISKWEKIAKDTLVGRTITDAFYLNEAEVGNMGWYQSGLVFVLDNGALAFVQGDDEGNGPGALYVQKDNTSTILPTI